MPGLWDQKAWIQILTHSLLAVWSLAQISASSSVNWGW